MKLPFSFLNSKKDESDYYLVLLLTEEKASAIILHAVNNTLKKIGSHEEFFTNSLEELSLDECITIVDKVISHAEEVLPPHIETHKTIFGLKSSWVEKETKKIKKEYLEQLKKVCDALDLSPIGFMVTTEAIAHLIQDEEGAPLSAVLAEIGKKQVTLTLLRGGKVIESITNHLLDSAPETVDRLLSHFTVPVLPARIVILLNKPNHEISNQTFIKHQWSKSLPFLHMPQITVLKEGFDSRAVMYGAASQMGFTVTGDAHAVLPKISTEENPEENEEEKFYSEAQETQLEGTGDNFEVVPVSKRGGDFGFVVDSEEEPKEQLHAEHTTHHQPLHHEMPKHEAVETHHEDLGDESAKAHPSRHKGKKIGILPTSLIPKNLPLPQVDGLLDKLKGKKAPIKIIIPLVIFLLLAIGTTLFYTYGTKATIALTMTPDMVEEEEKVTFSTDSSNDFEKDIVAARSISASIDGEASTDATGKKDIGEKAKGNVTLYNNSDNPINLNSGTELKASNGEVFLLDKDVKVASASGDIFTGTKPGTAQGSVTAKELGTEGNLPSGTRLTIGSTSILAARNDNAFSGGSKKSVTVVSKNDLAKLRIDLPKKVKDDAQTALSEQKDSGEAVLPLIGTATLEKEKFDKKEGEEAKRVTLHATATFSGIAYQEKDLKEYAETALKKKHNKDVSFAKDSIKETIKDAKQKDTKSATATTLLQGGLLPKTDTEDIIKNVKDKSPGEAKALLVDLPQVTKTDITFSPPMPILSSLFPWLPKQLTVELKTE